MIGILFIFAFRCSTAVQKDLFRDVFFLECLKIFNFKKREKYHLSEISFVYILQLFSIFHSLLSVNFY